MLLSELVAATDAVASTRARNEKIDILARLLRAAPSAHVPLIVGLVSGDPRQGRVGVGWATIQDLAVEPAAVPTLKVVDLDDLLTNVSETQGPGSQGARLGVLSAFMERATAPEADFVRRLLIGELRQGANAAVVGDAVARATDVPVSLLRRAVMLSGDLRTASAIAVAEGRDGLEAVHLEIFRPVQPMLASTAKAVPEAIAQFGESSVEWKLDGIRVQVHRDGSRVCVWTRNLNEITDRVPEVVRAVLDLDRQRLVLDGEILGVDADGAPLAFQESVAASTTVTAFFFDLLHDGDADLLDTPLRDRISRLRQIVGPLAVPGTITSDPEVAQQVLDEALGRGHEGVVVKDADSPYQAGRRGKGWLKVKPVHTLDLAVLAVEHGSGRRRGWLSNIHLGARNPEDGSFVMVGKTFKGMTDEMLEWQTRRFRDLAIRDDGRVVVLKPEQVVEIALDGVQTSTRYPGGVALRFARVVRYRDDKEPSEVDSIDTVRSMLER